MAIQFAPVITLLTVYMATRVLASLGFGFIVYTGLDVLNEQFLDNIRNLLGGVPADMLMLITRAGLIEALQINLAAVSIVISMAMLKRLTPL